MKRLLLPYLLGKRIDTLLKLGRRTEALALLAIEHEDNLEWAFIRLDLDTEDLKEKIGCALLPALLAYVVDLSSEIRSLENGAQSIQEMEKEIAECFR